MPLGQLARNEGRRLQGGGEEPPRYRTPREEERALNLGGSRDPEGFCGDLQGGGGRSPLSEGPREEEWTIR